MHKRGWILIGVAGLLSGACVAPAVVPAQPGATPAATPAAPGLDGAVQAARADAARRTGVAAESLLLLSAEAVIWSDGSLGCPQPGMAYTQALVPGYRIVLRGPAGELNYHASQRGTPMLCPAGRNVAPVPGGARY